MLKKGIQQKRRAALRKLPLHEAALRNQIEATEILLKEGLSPNVVNDYLHTPAHIAAYHGNLNVLEILIKHPDFDRGKTDCQQMTYLDWLARPLYKAVKEMDILMTIQLLDLGADPHCKAKKLKKPQQTSSQNAKSAFELASQLQNPTLLLFQKVNLKNDVEKGYINILRKFSLQELESMNDVQTSRTLLHVAAERDDVEVAKLLLDKGVLQKVSNNLQETPAHVAALKGSLNVLEVLTNHCDFDGKEVDKKGMTYLNRLATPLYEAVKNNEVRKVKRLLSFGADPDYLPRLDNRWSKKTARDLAAHLKNNTLPLLNKIPMGNVTHIYQMDRDATGFSPAVQ